MKIGFVDLDTSHPAGWLPVLRDMGHDVVGVFDSGDVHPPGYAADFAQQNEIPHVFDSIDELADAAELGIIFSADWDAHVTRAAPFAACKRAILIDKPMAGKTADLKQLATWTDQGLRIAGGSGLRFCREVSAYARCRDNPTTIVTSCGLGAFDYGIHAYAMLIGLMGDKTPPAAVQSLGAGLSSRAMINWDDGRCGIVVTGSRYHLPLCAHIVEEKSTQQFVVDTSCLYASFLQAVMPYLASETDEAPATPATLTLAETCALAAKASQERSGAAVALEGFDDAEFGYDGKAFAAAYRALKYPDAVPLAR